MRLPMKPLRPIAGRTLLSRTIALARAAVRDQADVELVVATDHQAIADHAQASGAAAVMTDSALASGSDRALAAVRAWGRTPDLVVNLQGDSPFQSPLALTAVINALLRGDTDVATPVVRLDWPALDALRAHKAAAPASGTTCAVAGDGRALWFSKEILPAMRDEQALRAQQLSPVWRHVGLYGYRTAALEAFAAAAPTELERLEGLEQLRLLELGLTVRAVPVAPAAFDISGIDTEADIARAEALIAAHGDPTPP